MIYDLTNSFLELGDATSRNLDFAYQKDVHISYGEETITETNLLELRRRHPSRISLKTFSHHAEAKNGADWEWHIVGKKWTFGMRVQAKRVQCDGKLKVKHEIGKSGREQIDVLLASAKSGGIGGWPLRPIYCFYCADRDMEIWSTSKRKAMPKPDRWSEYGCLIADAIKIKAVPIVRKLTDVEKHCVPWHYLLLNSPLRFAIGERRPVSNDDQDLIGLLERQYGDGPTIGDESSAAIAPTFPTADQLNGSDDNFSVNQVGIWPTAEHDYSTQPSTVLMRERGISRFLSIDVSGLGEAYD
ncbi:DUF6615 family protein [Falsihalocynthiibacter sp. S25ZX9]|uniref:DUF6615 family protein n=1 Tax=Falsihalocynthiibacter sp. S25ZX9 TaxID=3240870 RepID=UPI003510228C